MFFFTSSLFFFTFFPSSSSSSLSSRGDLNKLGAEALTFVIITVNSLYLVGGVFLLFKALAIEAGVGDKFASIRKRISSKNLIFKNNELHENETERGEEKTTTKNSKKNKNKNKKGRKNTRSKSKSKGGPKMVEMTPQGGGRKPMRRRPTAEIFKGADIHNNPLVSLQRIGRSGDNKGVGSGGGSGGGSGSEVKTKSQTSKPTVMGGFGGYGTVVLVGKKWKKKAAAAAEKKKQRLNKKKKKKREKQIVVEEEVEDVVPELIVDKASGRRYSINTLTGESQWVDKEEDATVIVDEVSGKR